MTPQMEARYAETGDVVKCAKAREEEIRKRQAEEFANVVAENVEKEVEGSLQMGQVWRSDRAGFSVSQQHTERLSFHTSA